MAAAKPPVGEITTGPRRNPESGPRLNPLRWMDTVTVRIYPYHPKNGFAKEFFHRLKVGKHSQDLNVNARLHLVNDASEPSIHIKWDDETEELLYPANMNPSTFYGRLRITQTIFDNEAHKEEFPLSLKNPGEIEFLNFQIVETQ